MHLWLTSLRFAGTVSVCKLARQYDITRVNHISSEVQAPSQEYKERL